MCSVEETGWVVFYVEACGAEVRLGLDLSPPVHELRRGIPEVSFVCQLTELALEGSGVCRPSVVVREERGVGW